jgi:hypothetical protein
MKLSQQKEILVKLFVSCKHIIRLNDHRVQNAYCVVACIIHRINELLYINEVDIIQIEVILTL